MDKLHVRLNGIVGSMVAMVLVGGCVSIGTVHRVGQLEGDIDELKATNVQLLAVVQQLKLNAIAQRKLLFQLHGIPEVVETDPVFKATVAPAKSGREPDKVQVGKPVPERAVGLESAKEPRKTPKPMRKMVREPDQGRQ